MRTTCGAGARPRSGRVRRSGRLGGTIDVTRIDSSHFPRAALAALLASATVVPAASAASAQQERATKSAEIPVCAQKLGSLAVVEPDRHWWNDYDLPSPEALIKMFVNRSKCFTLVDRGKGMEAAKAERELASEGELQRGSNIGKGQVKAADYVLVPDLVSRNRDSSGSDIGGLIGGLVGGKTGAVLGGVNLKTKTADVMLTVTDVRSSEQVAMTEGHAKKTDLGWGGAGGLFDGSFAGVGAKGYENTEIGQVITLAYLDAYTRLVNELGALPQNASSASVPQAVTMTKPGRMFSAPDDRSEIVRDLDPGMMLYPTGHKQGVLWEVEDEVGNKGWVSSLLFQLAR